MERPAQPGYCRWALFSEPADQVARGMSTFSSLLARHRFGFGIAGSLVSVAVAVIYLFVVPDEAASAAGPVRWILLYAHSLCWLLLAAASVCWLVRASGRLVQALAWTALGFYALFMVTFLAVRAGG